MAQAKILAICGSLRKASFNRRILAFAVQGAREAGGEVEECDLDLPLYNGDIEAQGLPPKVVALRDKIAAADGLLIAAPENNHGLSAALKNAIDWASRPPSVWPGKVAASCGATSGLFGTVRASIQLRTTLAAVQVTLLPQHVWVSQVHKKFDDQEKFGDTEAIQKLKELGALLVKTVGVTAVAVAS
ncbi:MAG: NAD(P)H-dependent oxidoreductase [Candidatus Tectomicrobia bacterium]|nr:NAD(P)H-dependent oxidoreductase [Candidatus Tectomicrobia bacterium]